MSAAIPVLLVIGGAAWLAQMNDTGNRLMELKFIPDGAKIDKSNTDLKKISLVLAFKIFNPGKKAINLQDFEGKLMYGNQEAALIPQIGPLNLMVPSNDEARIEIPVTIFTFHAGQLGLDMLADDDEEIELRVKGQVKANNTRLPVNEPIVLKKAKGKPQEEGGSGGPPNNTTNVEQEKESGKLEQVANTLIRPTIKILNVDLDKKAVEYRMRGGIRLLRGVKNFEQKGATVRDKAPFQFIASAEGGGIVLAIKKKGKFVIAKKVDMETGKVTDVTPT